MKNIKRLAERNAVTIKQLIAIWQSSVRATHDFLYHSDIEDLKPEVMEGLKYIEHLYVYECENNIQGFIAVEGQKIEMLFVENTARGQGIETQLIEYVKNSLNIKYVDVNEQNTQAVGFYLQMGFQVIGRSQYDDKGRPFPLLHLEINHSPY